MREAEPLQTVGAKGFATYWYKLWTTNCVFPGSTLLMQESVFLCPLCLGKDKGERRGTPC